MTRGAWMCRQYDDGLKIWLAAPRENEKPFIDSERAQKWRLSLASLLFFTVLLSDHLWFCAEARLTRARDKEQQQQQQRQQRQRQERQQRQRQQEPSWPALLAGMGEPPPAAQAHRLLSASPSPALPPSPGGGGGGGGGSEGGRGPGSRGKALPGNSAGPAWRLETCYPQGASSGQCFTVESADAVCARNWSRGAAARGERRQQTRGPPQPTPLWNLSDFYLSFCNSYTLWELFSGLSSPNTLNCSLDVVLKEGGEMTTCRQCVEAYQDYDHHAQEKYEEFESVLHKYLQSEEYSVKSCPEDCKIVYKAWLCSQYFEVAQLNCRKTIPCKQYCLEVQTRCPFILPDNDEVVYGGLSSFICTGLYETLLTNDEPECCDVRREVKPKSPSKGAVDRGGACPRTSLSASSAPRLGPSRLRLCVLVLMLLHTVLTASAAHNATALGVGGVHALDERSASEE